MEFQNITLSLPRNSLAKLKILAFQRNTSISHLLTKAIEKMLVEETHYEEARNRQIALMQKGFDLGFHKPLSRDDIHER
jgi:hypothetical protein